MAKELVKHSPYVNSRYQYGYVSITLHWLVFILIVGLMASGKYSDSLAGNAKNPMVITIHSQVGMVILLLMVFRLFWRIGNRTPEPISESGFANFLASLMHYGLYFFIILQAYVGVVMVQHRTEVHFLGIPLPSLTGTADFILEKFAFILNAQQSAGQQLRELHGLMADLLIVMIVLHIIAGLYNHLSGTDSLKRMLFKYQPAFAKKSHIE